MFRSLAFALLLMVSFTSFAGVPTKATQTKNKVLASHQTNQRYVFGQISDRASDQYMLDTKTGRLWIIVCADTNDALICNNRLLEPVPYVAPDGKNLSPEPR